MDDFRFVRKAVMGDIARVLERVDEAGVSSLVEAVSKARRVYAAGAGRSGCVARSFAIRLFHCGLQSFAPGDAASPPAGTGDVLCACSASGETAGVLCKVSLARAAGCKVACITSSPGSSLARAADISVCLELPGKPECPQPMGSLFEQAAFILLDCAVKLLAERTGQDGETLARRHGNLE